MKKMILAIVFLVVTASIATGATGSVSTTFSIKSVSQKGFLLHNDPVQQINIFCVLPGGFYGNLWFSVPWNEENTFGKEVDYTIGWASDLEKLGLGVNMGISYYDFIELFESEYDLINPHLRVNKKIISSDKSNLSFYLLVEHPYLTNSWDSGLYLYAGLKSTSNFSSRLSVYQDVQVLYDTGVFGLDKCFMGKYVLGGSLKVNGSVSINSTITVFSPLTSRPGGRETETIFGIGAGYDF